MVDIASFVSDNNASILNVTGSIVAFANGYDVFSPAIDVAPRFVASVNAAAADIKDDRLAGYLLQHEGPMMFRAGRLMHSAALNHKREYLEADARMREPAPSIDRKHDQERRARFRGMKPSAVLTAVANVDLADATALVADGNLADLPSNAWELAGDRFLVLNTLEKTAMRSNYALAQTLEKPLDSGVDERAAQRAAESVLQGHAARGEMVKIHERTLQDFVVVLAHAFGLSPADAFGRMLEA